MVGLFEADNDAKTTDLQPRTAFGRKRGHRGPPCSAVKCLAPFVVILVIVVIVVNALFIQA